MSEVKLLPCPFCGGKAEPIMVYVGRKDVVTTATRIVCKACGANTDKKYTEASAIYCWNTRKPMDDIVERLKQLYKYNSEQADIYRNAEDSDIYIREAIERYTDRANCYGVAIRTVRNGGKEVGGLNV